MLARARPPRSARAHGERSPNQMKLHARRYTAEQITFRKAVSCNTMPQLSQAPQDLRRPRRQRIGIGLSHTGHFGPKARMENPLTPEVRRAGHLSNENTQAQSGVAWSHLVGPRGDLSGPDSSHPCRSHKTRPDCNQAETGWQWARQRRTAPTAPTSQSGSSSSRYPSSSPPLPPRRDAA